MTFNFAVFGDLFDVPQRNGLTRPKKVRGTGLPMVNMGELFAHRRIHNIAMDLVPVDDKEHHYILNDGDLLFARQSLVLSGAGQCSIFMGNSAPTVFESHLIRCRLNPSNNNPLFYFYFFRSPQGRKAIDAIVEQGAGASGIRGSDLVKVLVPNPPKHIQDEVARALGEIDDRITLLRETNQTLEAIAQALFKSWFVNFEPVRAKAEGGSPEGIDAATVALFPDAFEETELGLVPKGWRVGCIDDLCETITNGGTPSRSKQEYWLDGDTPWYKTGELSDGFLLQPSERITKLAIKSSSVKVLPKNAVLMAIYAAPTVGRLGVLTEPSTFNQACTGMIPKPEVGTWFLYWCLYFGRDWFNSRANGAAQQNISKAIVSNYKIVIPNANLLDTFNTVCDAIHSSVRKNSYQAETLSNLRDTLLPRLISGQLRIADAETEIEKAMA